ncbi:hypothetical protein [Photobacterium carnosum]|uniref:hypothetical protein n=1 Tax=Photobacterium carnosum TaxID=2023717 RepID=UPI001E3526CD|nr:hypothetical protein [Photobacterium carnosum]MCD9539298.1 hypothetical protein [Photobacterium carnosum]MCF2161718.1 hypothetical protein [Photobacterium carnosum]
MTYRYIKYLFPITLLMAGCGSDSPVPTDPTEKEFNSAKDFDQFIIESNGEIGEKENITLNIKSGEVYTLKSNLVVKGNLTIK